VSRSNGLSFETSVTTGISSSDIMLMGDIDGDGLKDLIYPSGGTWHYRLHAGARPDLLGSVTDGFGNVTSFAYASLAQDAYSKYATAGFPEQEYGGTGAVVSRITRPDGIGGTYYHSYWYYGGRTHLQGRGFEGFAARRTLDSRNGVYAYEYFPRNPAMSEYTLTDQKMIDELEKGRERLLSSSSSEGLMRVLRRRLQSITPNVYVLRWIPEQREDLYDVLVDGATVAHVEISRRNPDEETVFETWPVEEYRRTRKSLTKPERRKLELALQLARSLNATHNRQ
jgi:hypothetical protein